MPAALACPADMTWSPSSRVSTTCPAPLTRSARRANARLSGSVVIADELVEYEFTAPASDLERYHYGWSVVAAPAGAMGYLDTAATGAVMRPATLRRYAEQACCCEEILPIETETLGASTS